MDRHSCERCAECGRGLTWIEIAFGRLGDPVCGRCLIERRADQAQEWTVEEVLAREG